MTVADYVALRESRGATVRKVQDGWMVTCPAHDDGTPSLHVSEGNDGRVLLCDQAGCAVEDVLAADRLTAADLFKRSANGHREIVETYPYVDELGVLLFEVVRFAPKDFRQRRPDGSWGVKGVRRVLYRLPDVIKAVEDGRRVWIAEGEKDVAALEASGQVATCCPGGAGKWRDEYSARLAGAHVVIVVDDDQAGEKHAQAVRASVQRHAARVAVVKPATGKDAHDHLTAGLELRTFVPWTPSSDGVQEIGRRVTLTTANEIRSERVLWLWDGRMPLRGETVVAGEKGLGKSILTNAWMVAALTRGTLDGGSRVIPPMFSS
jgi:putative DNA primase/helicase